MAPPIPNKRSPSSSSDDDQSSEEEEVHRLLLKTPQQAQSKSSSDTDEDDDGSREVDDEDESGSDDDVAPSPSPKPTTTKPTDKPTKPPASEADSSEGEDEESGSDDDDVAPSPSPKPTTTKSTDKLPAPEPESSEEDDDQGSGSEEDDVAASHEPVKPNAQEVDMSQDDDMPLQLKADVNNEASLKRKRGAEKGQKKNLFHRVWSSNDEIEILHGLIRYRDGVGSIRDMTAFYDFVRGSLERDTHTKHQVLDKVRKLKQKFLNIYQKSSNAMDPSFPNQHEKAVFELSKNLWEADATKFAVENSRSKVPSSNDVNEDIRARCLYLASAIDKIASEQSCGMALKRSLDLIDEDKAMAMDEKVKKLKLKETKHHLRKIQLVRDSVKLIVDALSKSH